MKTYFQDFMPGNICFGCGKNHPEGLRIKSYWDGDISKCNWDADQKYSGWKGILYGGTIASLFDCHSMCTAMAYAYKIENRRLDSEPIYRFATGSLAIKYLKPTPIGAIEVHAMVNKSEGKKIFIECALWAQGKKTATAEAIAFRVYDSSVQADSIFNH